MEENAIMGVYCRRFGVPLIDGGTVRLQAMVGLSRALDFILTGRSIDAKEAYSCGLANRIVACGTSSNLILAYEFCSFIIILGLGQAMQVATSLVKFPQACLNADRNSTYNAAFAESYSKLLKYEQENGLNVIASESIDGAKKFVSGIGRHGKFYNLTEKSLPEWETNDCDIKNKL